MNAKGWQTRVLGLVMAVGFTASAMAQNQPQGGRVGAPNGGRAGGQGQAFQQGQGNFQQMDPAQIGQQIRQTMSDRIREELQATDEEWAVLGPRIQKIQGLNADASSGISGMTRMMRGGFGGGGAGGGGRAGQGQGQGGRGGAGGVAQLNIQSLLGGSNAMAQKMQDLSEAISNPNMPESEIKSRLAAVRAERERVRAELAVARMELVQLLTQRQEAILFQMGVLE